MFRRDPRLVGTCAVHGRMSLDEGEMSWRIRTYEDVVANRTALGQRQHAGKLGSPYGRLFKSQDGTLVLYVEIPKTGSTTVKSYTTSRIPELTLDHFVATTLSFTVVREPLQRFISGYGTVLARGKKLMEAHGVGAVDAATFKKMEARQRFEAFVDLIVVAGDRMHLYPPIPPPHTVWFHTLTQAWFLELMPLPIDFVLHLETLEEDFKWLNHKLNIGIPFEAHVRTNNQAEIKHIMPNASYSWLVGRPDIVTKLVDVYLEQDYACLGYPKPTAATIPTLLV